MSILRPGNAERGFTLTELLIASVIMMLIIAGAASVYFTSYKSWRRSIVVASLQRDGGLAMEEMVRGVGGENGIREAESVSLPDVNTIRYTSGIDGLERGFYLSDSNIMHDPDTSASGDEFIIAENVSSLTFSTYYSMVTINLGIQGQVNGESLDMAFETGVTIRN